MNFMFENIFEKYNLSREISRKRQRRTQSGNFNRKDSPILSCRDPNRSTCYFNNHSRTKYNIPTRYNRLETVKVGNGVKLQNCSLTEYAPFDKSSQCKENEEESSTSSGARTCDTVGADFSQTQTTLGCIGNINNIRLNNTPDKRHLINIEADVPFEMNGRNFNITESSFLKSCASDNTEQLTSQINQNGSSELDLLIDLIEQEGPVIKKQPTRAKRKENILKCDDCLLVTKRRLKGGCQEMFEHSLKQDKAKSNFLKYDKKLGLRIGHLLIVVKIEVFHGITLATVRSHDLNKNFAVVVSREMALCLKVGSQIEAFFDDNTHPYKLFVDGEHIDAYIDPYKLICL